jgi:ABC-2 type transport system permease protein
MNAVLALAKKDLLLLFRDKFALFWILAFPLMFALFFGAIFKDDGGGGRGAISIAVVDEDGSDVARALVTKLSEHASVRLVRTGEGDDGPVEAPSLEEARELVQKGRRVAYLRIPRGYGETPYAVFGGGGVGPPVLELGIDPGRRAEAGLLQGVMMEVVFGSLQSRFTDKETLRGDLASARAEIAAADDLGAGQKAVLETFLGALGTFVDGFDLDALDGGEDGGGGGGFGRPLEIVDVTRDRSRDPRSTFDITFPQALVWGLMSVALGFAITLVRERTSGTLLRLRMAPISRTQLLAGKALGCFVACLLTMTVLMGFGALALGVRFDDVPLLLVAMVCTAACFTGLMMTVSVMGKTEAAVAGSSWGLMMPFAMIGGGMIPLIAMPGWLQKASQVSFFKWAIVAVEGAVWRGFGPRDMLLPCAVLLLFGAVFFALGVAIFRRIDG